jgi:hypothetical protein
MLARTRRQTLDALRVPRDSRASQPAMSAGAVRGQKSHPSLWRRVDDEIRRGLSARPRPSLTVEAEGVGAVRREAKHPRDGMRKTAWRFSR